PLALELKSDGTVTGWGNNSLGQIIPPSGLTGVIAIAAGSAHSLALTLHPTVAVTIDSAPGGLRFTVTGNGCQAGDYGAHAWTLQWAPGASCTVTYPSPQSQGSSIRYVFSSWADDARAGNSRFI